MPIVNTTVLGALVGLLPEIMLNKLTEAIKEGKVPKSERNINAAKQAYKLVVSGKHSQESAENDHPESIIQQIPAYRDKMPPCEPNCPAGHAIHKTISFIQKNRFEDALKNIKTENPFPGVCGRVCFHPCETHCNANEHHGGLAINALERAAADYADIKAVRKPFQQKKTGKKVAIIGSGPTGMTGAYFLTQMGHAVTVLEALPVLGGIPKVGIPDYRLPKEILDNEIQQIIDLGIDIKTNTRVGQKIFFEDIFKQYDACFIAIGAHRSIKLNIPGEDDKGVIPGIEFLKRMNSGDKIDLSKTKVAVIGGGNTAVDAARSSIRLRAQEVTIIYRRSSEEIPAYWEELEAAEKEGIKIRYLAAPIKIHHRKDRVAKLECLKTKLVETVTSGRRHPEMIENTNFTLPVEIVIVAIGETIDTSFLPHKIEMNGPLIKVDELGRTSIPGLYAGGDATNVVWNVPEAIGSGKRAAIGIDLFLKGGNEGQVLEAIQRGNHGVVSMGNYLAGNLAVTPAEGVSFNELNMSYFPKVQRAHRMDRGVQERIQNFKEVRLGLPKMTAIEEARRCFQCGICTLCENCYIFCPDIAISQDEKNSSLVIDSGLCKGCGICINECPRGAVSWEGECE
jgi:NADPH-dependent glutamate synthase beta subunit-like oxidoreductase